MAKQSRFETATYRGSEIRVRAEQADLGSSWTVWVDVYNESGERRPRLRDPGASWATWQEAIDSGVRAGRKLVDA